MLVSTLRPGTSSDGSRGLILAPGVRRLRADGAEWAAWRRAVLLGIHRRMTCAFCGREAAGSHPLDPLGGESCPSCLARLGRTLVDLPRALIKVWGALAEEDDHEPEPRVRLPDGRLVELRERTAELKRDLGPEKRLELARTLGQLGLRREAIVECGHVLAAEPPRYVARAAVAFLMSQKGMPKDALARIRAALFPG
jgi:hypothetical protein